MPAKLLRNARTKTSLSYPHNFNAPRVCLRCQLHGLETRRSALIERFESSTSHGARIGKPFSTTSDTGNGRLDHKESVDESQSRAKPRLVDTESLVTARKYVNDNTSKYKQHPKLPKQLSLILAELTAKAILVGQKANSLTGTDYSAIEALRKTIKEQGELWTTPIFHIATVVVVYGLTVTIFYQSDWSPHSIKQFLKPGKLSMPLIRSKPLPKKRSLGCWSENRRGRQLIWNVTWP